MTQVEAFSSSRQFVASATERANAGIEGMIGECVMLTLICFAGDSQFRICLAKNWRVDSIKFWGGADGTFLHCSICPSLADRRDRRWRCTAAAAGRTGNVTELKAAVRGARKPLYRREYGHPEH
jgi:hypothetical protein